MYELAREFDPSIIWEYRSILAQGLAVNAEIFLLAVPLALVIGLFVSLCRTSMSPALRTIGGSYVEVFRNIPEYVLLVWFYYVLPTLASRAIGYSVTFNPILSSICALGMAYGGYFAETLRAGIQSVPKGQVEAAIACGLSQMQIRTFVILPQAFRRMFPEALNQSVSLFKATTLVSLIAVHDLMESLSVISGIELRPLPLYTGAALIFFAIVYSAMLIVRKITNRWHRRGWA